VLYVLDGETLFLPMSGHAEWHQYVQRTPGLIVVAIPNTHRSRDLATPWTSPTPPQDYQKGMVRSAGGAEAFLRFVSKELVPDVERRYRTVRYRILLGHSLGGYWALYALAKEPGLFQATIAISPPVSWNGDSIIKDLAAEFAKPSLPRQTLFIGAATNEGGDTLAGVYRLVDLLSAQAPGSLRWKFKVFEDEDHGTVALPAAHAGIQFSFQKWRIPGVVADANFKAVERYYADLSREYGFEVPVQEWYVTRLGYEALRKGDRKRALEFFAGAVRHHPNSANAHDCLGEALEADGQLAEARRMYEKAVALGEQADPSLRATFRNHLNAVGEKLKKE
jgi:predicted alpha/beta superfamily hydrolase